MVKEKESGIYYRQCELVLGLITHIAWIPEKFSKRGRILRIKFNGKWTDGWIVKNIYSRLPENIVINNRDEYRYHRGVTDI